MMTLQILQNPPFAKKKIDEIVEGLLSEISFEL